MRRTIHNGDAGDLCKNCGLCCNGSLFSEVELGGRTESDGLEAIGLNIEDADEDEPAVLIQPCGALRGTRCSIYPHRPDCCRTFECGLLKKVLRGDCTVEAAREKVETLRVEIQGVMKLLQNVRGRRILPLREAFQEALEISPGDNGNLRAEQRVELEARMGLVEETIRQHFLND